jgi:hypothetical protein
VVKSGCAEVGSGESEFRGVVRVEQQAGVEQTGLRGFCFREREQATETDRLSCGAEGGVECWL